MLHHFELTDLDFERLFSERKISAGIFNHEAHLRLAWIHIEKYGVDIAERNICSQLKSFVHHLGAGEKYNETVTIAAVKAVYHFKLKSNTNNFPDFIEENPRLKSNFKDLIRQHYSEDIFASSEAKQKFLVPDLLPFD
jgi:hypothetical protein